MYWQRVAVSTRLGVWGLETNRSCWRAVKLSGHEAEVVVVDWRRRREVLEEEERGERVRRRRERKRRREKRDIGGLGASSSSTAKRRGLGGVWCGVGNKELFGWRVRVGV